MAGRFIKDREGRMPRPRDMKLTVIVPRDGGKVDFLRAIKIAKDTGFPLPPNRRFSRIPNNPDERKEIEKALPGWSGTMAAYVEPGAELGKFVIYTDSNSGKRWVFPVPEEFRREKDSLLVAEYPYLVKPEGNDLVISAKNVDCIGQFPAEKAGWYLGDAVHDLPQGEMLNEDNAIINPKARQLLRLAKRVGPVVREKNDPSANRFLRTINLVALPSVKLGLIAETALEPEKGVPFRGTLGEECSSPLDPIFQADILIRRILRKG
ncbi:hypothetical protein JW721_00465 [Candidatus Micrarchaeota archaeon]|nr:hypothetical protein [Candidatus Micrarchaeota archaeon]